MPISWKVRVIQSTWTPSSKLPGSLKKQNHTWPKTWRSAWASRGGPNLSSIVPQSYLILSVHQGGENTESSNPTALLSMQLQRCCYRVEVQPFRPESHLGMCKCQKNQCRNTLKKTCLDPSCKMWIIKFWQKSKPGVITPLLKSTQHISPPKYICKYPKQHNPQQPTTLPK